MSRPTGFSVARRSGGSPTLLVLLLVLLLLVALELTAAGEPLVGSLVQGLAGDRDPAVVAVAIAVVGEGDDAAADQPAEEPRPAQSHRRAPDHPADGDPHRGAGLHRVDRSRVGVLPTRDRLRRVSCRDRLAGRRLGLPRLRRL